MRFAWKVFLSTVIVIAVVFAIGGFILITSFFDSALSRETDRGVLKENQLTKLAYESAATTYVNQGEKLTDEAVINSVSSLESSGRRGIVVADENYETVFTSTGRSCGYAAYGGNGSGQDLPDRPYRGKICV